MFKKWVERHQSALIILTSLWLIILAIHFFGWWEALGILFLKFGLGAKVAGAKTFAHAIAKAGGHKAIATATAGMLAKRHIIDLFSKFFAEHSLKRYKANLTHLFKMKIKEIRNSSLIKKLKAFGSMLLSIPIFYLFWTKVLSTAIQKIVYALVVPLFSILWSFITAGLNIFNFLLKIVMLNVFVDALAQYRWGRWVLKIIDTIVAEIIKLFSLLNHLFGFIGLNPKLWLIRVSLRFNHWIEDILDDGLNYMARLQNRRDRYVNVVETLSQKRFYYTQNRRKKRTSFWKHTKKLFSKHVLKKRDWREMREKKIEQKRQKFRVSVNERRSVNLKKKRERHPLLLLYRSA
jgi:hypothetical protein